VTCLPALLTASVVIAASLLGGCSDFAIGTPGRDSPVAAQATEHTSQPLAEPRVGERLASLALDDHRLSEIRGGVDAGSGVVLNFAFQQATFVNHNLVQSVVVPTLTVSPSQGAVSNPSVNLAALTGLGITASPSVAGATNISSATVVGNATVQTQVSVSAATIQALVNSGMATVVGTGSSGGVSSVVTNTANNTLVQQMTTLNIGVTGLSKLIQQGIPSTVLSRLSGPNSFR
jgi:hypothetical protein